MYIRSSMLYNKSIITHNGNNKGKVFPSLELRPFDIAMVCGRQVS